MKKFAKLFAFLLLLPALASAQYGGLWNTPERYNAAAVAITGGTISGIGGDTMSSDAAARSSLLHGSNAYPQATVNTTGGDAKVCAGIGRRLFTIVDYSLIDAIDTVTVTVNGSASVKTAGGTDWTAATSNAATATSLATAISAISGVTATASGSSVYITPAASTCTLTLATSMDAGEGTATSGTDGTVTVTGATPQDATYWTSSSNATLTNETNLGALTTGLTLNTVAAGVGTPSAYGGTSCTNQFPRSLNASGAATCASVGDADLNLSTPALGTPASGVATNLTGTASGLTAGVASNLSNASLSTYAAYIALPGVIGNYASTPDSAAASVAGDIDIRIDLAMTDWTPAANSYLVAKSGTAGQRGYSLHITTGGILTLITSNDGSAQIAASATAATGVADGARSCVRVTRDVDNGAAGNDTIFYTASDYPTCATWVQLGTTVTNAGTTSIFDSTGNLRVGIFNNDTGPLAGKVYRAQVYSGIAGTLVADFNPALSVAGASTFTAATGEVWTTNTSGTPPALMTGITSSQSVGETSPSLVRVACMTVAQLPVATQGTMACVTDATGPTYLGALTGGGAVVTPVFHNGTAWVSH